MFFLLFHLLHARYLLIIKGLYRLSAVILQPLRAGLISKDEAKETVLKMVSKGFRIEPNLLARLIIEIERVYSKSIYPSPKLIKP